MNVESAEVALAYTYAWWLTGDASAARAAVLAAVDRPDVPGADAGLRMEILLRRVRAAAVAEPTMCPASELALLHDAIGLGLDAAAGLALVDARDARTELAHGRLEALDAGAEFTITAPERLGGLAVGNPADVAAARQDPQLSALRKAIFDGRDELVTVAKVDVPQDLLEVVAARQRTPDTGVPIVVGDDDWFGEVDRAAAADRTAEDDSPAEAGIPADGAPGEADGADEAGADEGGADEGGAGWADGADESGADEGDGAPEGGAAEVGAAEVGAAEGDAADEADAAAGHPATDGDDPAEGDGAAEAVVSAPDRATSAGLMRATPRRSAYTELPAAGPASAEEEIDLTGHVPGAGGDSGQPSQRRASIVWLLVGLVVLVGVIVLLTSNRDDVIPDPGTDVTTSAPAPSPSPTAEEATTPPATATPTASPDPFTIGRAGVAVGIGSDPDFGNPTAGPFDPVSVTVEYSGAEEGDALLVDWTVDGAPFDAERVDLSPVLESARFSKQVPEAGWPVGQHTLTFALERTGEVVGEAGFQVVPAEE